MENSAIKPDKEARVKVYDLFEQLGIPYELIEHPPMFSEADNEKCRVDRRAKVLKNLFLRNKERSNYYLLTLPLDKRADLVALQKLLGEKKLSFGGEEELREKLNIAPGSVSLLNIAGVDKAELVFLIDEEVFDYNVIGLHPNDNTATMAFSPEYLRAILESYGADYRFVGL